MTKICILFDVDGTLVDSEGLENQAFLDLLPTLNESLDTLIRRYRGQQLAPVLADLEVRLGLNLPKEFEDTYRRRVAELFSSELKPMPGVKEMLEASMTPRCIASGGPQPKIRHALEISGLSLYFGERIYSSYDVNSWKPEPGLFLHAAQAMGYRPELCAVIEDSDVGVQAALAAGMTVFQYLPNNDRDPCPGGMPFDDMSQLSQLLAKFSGRVAP